MNTEKINLLYGYPELTEKGKENTQKIIDKFQKDLFEVMNSTLVSFTQNLATEIVDDDSWVDLRDQVKSALCAYPSNGEYRLFGHDWIQIRKKILEENRETIVNDIILDKEKEIQLLKERIAFQISK